MYLIDGQWLEHLPANDRGLQFGDGCFTTARIVNGEIRFISRHLTRLWEACDRLMIPRIDESLLRGEMARLAQEKGCGVIKVVITRGSGGRGYSPAGCQQPRRILSVADAPAQYRSWKTDGIDLVLSPVRLGCNPALAGIKHLNRLEQVLIRTHLEQTTAQDALVLDSDGMLVECCAANLFWRKGHRVYTPAIDRAGVNGTMRQHIIDCLGNTSWSVSEARVGPEALSDADEIVVCNALMPIIPVKQIPGTRYTERELCHYLAPLCE